MLLATRQLAASALRPALSQPCRYIGQCEATQFGCRKFAEIGSQPRAAAAMMPLENGAVTVTRIGGGGVLKGVWRKPRAPLSVKTALGARGPNFAFRLLCGGGG